MNNKLKIFKKNIIEMLSKQTSIAVAFSGGVDSSLIAKLASEAIGNDNVLLISAIFDYTPLEDIKELEIAVKELNLNWEYTIIEVRDIPNFIYNPPDRCFHCKRYIFGRIKSIAESHNINIVVDGSNKSDIDDFRPGLKALKELNILSPFAYYNVTKTQIRELAKSYRLNVATKPSESCPATRFKYNTTLNVKDLTKVISIEKEIKHLGFSKVRARIHDRELIRLEFLNREIDKAWSLRNKLTEICKEEGFSFITIDCEGYKIGSFNKILSKEIIKKYKGK